MKKQFLFIIFIFSFLQQSFSQNPLVKQWDKRFGGTFNEHLYCIIPTKDNGVILGGESASNISGDKSQNSFGNFDYWIIKIDSLGNKQWDKDFGGSNWDALTSISETSDGGYILGGFSASMISGNKTQNTWGDWDYWIVKIDSLGNKQWDKDFGGTGFDMLYSLKQTNDKGYILGGYSNTGINGNKTQNTWGLYDYWIVKTDSLGNKQWDKDFGASDIEYLYSIQQTKDGGYILGGTSYSYVGGDKSQVCFDTSAIYRGDYWILKTDSLGIKQWDKDFGGVNTDFLSSIYQTNDGYLLGGFSGSSISGTKTIPVWDTCVACQFKSDFYIIKIDSLGIQQWDKGYGGTLWDDDFTNISPTIDGGYLLAGTSYSNISGDKTENNLGNEQSWIIKTDSLGNKQWDKTLLTNTGPDDDEIGFATQTKDGCYVMGNWTIAGIGGNKTQLNWDTIPPIDADYWIIKFCDTTSTTSITQIPDNPNTFSIYPNPANEYVTINYHFKAGDEIQLTDVLGKLLFTTKMKTPSSDFRLPTSDLSPGIYSLKAGSEVRKFLKE